jgi:hypothetical protein
MDIYFWPKCRNHVKISTCSFTFPQNASFIYGPDLSNQTETDVLKRTAHAVWMGEYNLYYFGAGFDFLMLCLSWQVLEGLGKWTPVCIV